MKTTTIWTATTTAAAVVTTILYGSQHLLLSTTAFSTTSPLIPLKSSVAKNNNSNNSPNHQHHQQQHHQQRSSSISVWPLFMGRAAAVRAATKAKTDMKKAKTNAIFGKRIIMAIKSGGSPDPVANRALSDVIKQAKANNVPVDNINRAIKRASEANAGDFTESTFEAYGLGGASMVINVLSDNANRATADVKSTVNKRGGKIAEQGSVLFMYDKKGRIEVPNAVLEEETLLDVAIEAGIEDFILEPMDSPDGDGGSAGSVILVEPTDSGTMLDAVKTMGYEDAKMSLTWITKAPVECTDEDFEKNMEIIEALEELDDVDSVEHNMSN